MDNMPIGEKSGESLIEAVVSITIIMITLGYSGSVIASGFSQLAESHNRVVATSLAKEGLESMRNIIGSNLVRLSEDTENCWNAGFVTDDEGNTIPVQETADCEDNKIGDAADTTNFQTFRLIFDWERGFFYLSSLLVPELSQIRQNPRFGLYVINGNGDYEGSVPPLSGEERYLFVDCEAVNDSATGPFCSSPPQARFYRAIEIRYGDLGDPPDPDTLPDFIEVTSYVSWSSDTDDSVTLSTIITSQ